MQKIELSNQEDVRNFHKAKRAQILEAFDKGTQKTARLITKAEFEEEYPADKFERYSLPALNKFRMDLTKAEGVEDKDAAFKNATADLKSFVVQDGDNKTVVFVRKKETGE